MTTGSSARAAAVCGLLAISVAPIAASAQVNPFRGSDEKVLTDEDMRLMSAAASKLREDEQTPLGRTESWSNPTTGNFGTVTLLQRFQKNDLPCQKIRHAYRSKTQSDTATFDLDVCKVATGEWKIAF